MTTKVVVSCPDNSMHDGLVYVEQKQADGSWSRTAAPTVVKPRKTAAPVYITSSARVVVEEGERGDDEPKPKA